VSVDWERRRKVSLAMDNPQNATPDSLCEKAEQCFRLAYATGDERVREVLVAYGHELLERAKHSTKPTEGTIARTAVKIADYLFLP